MCSITNTNDKKESKENSVKLTSIHLEAPDSPRKAFYRIWIEDRDGFIEIIKESGCKDKVLDTRHWPFQTIEDAEKEYMRRVKQKMNPDRKSPRKYRLIKRQ